MPTFRPDALLQTADPAWPQRLELLEARADAVVEDLDGFLAALRDRREHFRRHGATASDHGVADPFVTPLERGEAERLFAKALDRTIDQDEAARLSSHLLFEMAGMAADDGLVMQLHVGSFRNHDQRVFERFGPERYLVGDAARRDSDGYFWVIGRIDDVVNVSGHRLSTAEVESAIVAHESVAEAAVIGRSDEDTGQAICAFVTLTGDLDGSDGLVEDIRATVAERIGKFARPKRIVWAEDLPKTRSGKIMRRLLRDIAEGRALGDVTTLRDPEVMAELEAKIAERRSAED